MCSSMSLSSVLNKLDQQKISFIVIIFKTAQFSCWKLFSVIFRSSSRSITTFGNKINGNWCKMTRSCDSSVVICFPSTPKEKCNSPDVNNDHYTHFIIQQFVLLLNNTPAATYHSFRVCHSTVCKFHQQFNLLNVLQLPN
jgi:hypothetical protein